jgi:hypothetical protein
MRVTGGRSFMRSKITVLFAAFAALVLTASAASAAAAVTTPEPVSVSLLAIGVGGLVLARRFRRK